MERNIPGIHLVLFVLSARPYAATSALSVSMVVPVSGPETWEGAVTYCKQHHRDLFTVAARQEAARLLSYEGWIRLHEGWQWYSSLTGGFVSMNSGGSSSNNECWMRKNLSVLPLVRTDCHESHPFLCDDTLILVQEKKTWEEALLHCRALEATTGRTTNTHDLASLPEENHTLVDTETVRQKAATKEVWVGLRFLAGEWLWMNGQAATSSGLPRCPARQQHCGALVPGERGWRVMDCNERRDFLCMKR